MIIRDLFGEKYMQEETMIYEFLLDLLVISSSSTE
jgi:hypothetical protein